jgi:hypothetical protein
VRRGPDRLNAAVLMVLALLLLGVGAYGLARGYGAFGDARAGDPVLTDDVRNFVSRNSDWFWPVAAVLSLLVAWLGLRWLVAQLTTATVGHLPVRADGPGHTELLGAGATSALARDIEEYPGVRSASARLIGDHPVPEISLTVDVHDDADIAAVRRRIEEHALVRFRSALELTKLRSQIHVRLAPRAGRSVR